MAINLAESIRGLGHEVILWSPHPLEKTRWWRALQQMRSKADAFIASQKPFDVIDCPATLITRKICRSASVVARSTQPSLLYLVNQLASDTRKNMSVVRLPFNYAYTFFHSYLILQGWRRADSILCLGSKELQWMRKWFPWWRNKLTSYLNALSVSDQAALATVRRQRNSHESEAIRFLWIGRWTGHKGTDILLEFINDWSKHRPQDSFTIAGCGAEAEKDCSSEFLRSGRLKIIPSFTREELYSLLAGHDAGLFTSEVEGWGLSLNEMLESGLQVFATPAGATIDLQPFFVNRLKQFPPAPNQLCHCSINDDAMKNYYETFTWASIASKYIDSVCAVKRLKAKP